ncbi:MAG: class I SAM-dependent methyltransferase [Planctomycetota bacterium]
MDALQDFYNKKSIGYQRNSIQDPIYQYILQEIQREHLNILDVGCSYGDLGKALQKKSHKVYGIEIADESAQTARQKLTEVIIGNIETINLPWQDGFFDVIIGADILEHLISPKDALDKLSRCLKTGGILLVSIPNIAHWRIRWKLLRGKWDYKKTGILDDGHLRFFTYDSAVNLLEQSGYNVIRSRVKVRLPTWLKMLNKLWSGVSKVCQFYFPGLFGYQFLMVARKK